MKAKMSTDKASQEPQPVPVIDLSTVETIAASKSSRLTKKHVLIAVVSMLVVGLLVAGVLVAIRIFTDSQKEMLKYSITFKDAENNKVNQTVSVADNSVIYHVERDGVEGWIINDFDKNIQVIKTKTDKGVACYATPLNRSLTQDPDSVSSSASPVNQTTNTHTLKYTVLPYEIDDITFLGPKISNACSNIPTYWRVPSCNDGEGGERVKRRVTVIIITYRDGSTVVIIIISA